MKRLPLIYAKRGGRASTVPPSKSREDIPRNLALVIQQAYSKPFSLQSEFARGHAFYVAAAASLGYITTRTTPRGFCYGHLWRATKSGLHFLESDS